MRPVRRSSRFAVHPTIVKPVRSVVKRAHWAIHLDVANGWRAF
jgi:hypothetical protein